jgi:hypothetical protein
MAAVVATCVGTPYPWRAWSGRCRIHKCHFCGYVVNLKLRDGLGMLLCCGTISKDQLTINVPVVYMGRDIWIWMGGNQLRGPLEGISGPTPSNGPRNGFPPIQPHIKTGTLVILWTRDFRAHSEMVSKKFWILSYVHQVCMCMGSIEGGGGVGWKFITNPSTPPPPHPLLKSCGREGVG